MNMEVRDVIGIVVVGLVLVYGVVGSIMIWRATDFKCKNLILPCVRITITEKK